MMNDLNILNDEVLNKRCISKEGNNPVFTEKVNFLLPINFVSKGIEYYNKKVKGIIIDVDEEGKHHNTENKNEQQFYMSVKDVGKFSIEMLQNTFKLHDYKNTNERFQNFIYWLNSLQYNPPNFNPKGKNVFLIKNIIQKLVQFMIILILLYKTNGFVSRIKIFIFPEFIVSPKILG